MRLGQRRYFGAQCRAWPNRNDRDAALGSNFARRLYFPL